MGLVTPAKGETAQEAAIEAVILNNALTADQQRTLRHLQRLTHVMDSAFTIPVINRKIGLDGIIGLVSGLKPEGLQNNHQSMWYSLMLPNSSTDDCHDNSENFYCVFDHVATYAL